MSAKEYKLKVNHLNIALKEWGDQQGTPIIALHGWLDNAGTFDRLAPLLPDYRFIAVDLPGHGLSDWRPLGSRYHLLDNLDEVIGLADALELDQFILLGHSMGAGIATLLAGSFPDRIIQLLLIEGIGTQSSDPATAPEIAAKAVLDNRATNRQKSSVFPTLETAIQARTLSFGGISLAAATSLSQRGVSKTDAGYCWHADPQLKAGSIIRLTEPMVEAYIDRLTMPVTLVLGEDSFFAGWKALTDRSQRLKQGTVVRLAGNHHLHLEPATVGPIADCFNKALKL